MTAIPLPEILPNAEKGIIQMSDIVTKVNEVECGTDVSKETTAAYEIINQCMIRITEKGHKVMEGEETWLSHEFFQYVMRGEIRDYQWLGEVPDAHSFLDAGYIKAIKQI